MPDEHLEYAAPTVVLSDRKREFADSYIVSHFSVRKACRAIELDERTGRSWVNDPDVRQYLDAQLSEFRENAVYALPSLARSLLEQALTPSERIFDAVLSEDPIQALKSLSEAEKAIIAEVGFDLNGRPKVKLRNKLSALELAFKVMDAQTAGHLAKNAGNTFNFQLILAPDKGVGHGEAIQVTPEAGGIVRVETH